MLQNWRICKRQLLGDTGINMIYLLKIVIPKVDYKIGTENDGSRKINLILISGQLLKSFRRDKCWILIMNLELKFKSKNGT